MDSCCSVAELLQGCGPAYRLPAFPPSLSSHSHTRLSFSLSLSLSLSLYLPLACVRARARTHTHTHTHTHTCALALAMRQGLGHDMRGDELGELHSWLSHTLYELN